METLTVVENAKELQIWMTLVQSNLNMRKTELEFLGLCEYV